MQVIKIKGNTHEYGWANQNLNDKLVAILFGGLLISQCGWYNRISDCIDKKWVVHRFVDPPSSIYNVNAWRMRSDLNPNKKKIQTLS